MSAFPPDSHFILTLSCTDQPGIVGAVGTLLADQRCNILESAQFGDAPSRRFMMRVLFERLADAPPAGELRRAFEPVAARFAMTWAIDDAAARPRVLILVSRFDHCLNDLLYRYRIGAIDSRPRMNGRSASGITTDPSACW